MTTPSFPMLPAALRARFQRAALRQSVSLPNLVAKAALPSFSPADLRRADEDLLHVDVRAC